MVSIMDESTNSDVLNAFDELINDFSDMLKSGLSSYEKYFGKENINFHVLDINDYTITIKSTISFLVQARDLYVKNEKIIDDVGLNDELLKCIKQSFYRMSWVVFEDEKSKKFRKPTKEEVSSQVKSYLAILNINARHITNVVKRLVECSNNHELVYEKYFKNIISKLEDNVFRADEIIVNLNKRNEFAKSQKTIDIYRKAKNFYGINAFLARLIFLFFLVSAPVSALFLNVSTFELSTKLYDTFDDINIIKFFIFRIPFALVLVSISIYFLKLSSFYLNKCEDAKKIYYELSAFPFYVSELSKEEINELRKTFAHHYFGKDVNYELFDRMSNVSNTYADITNKSMSTIIEILKHKTSPNK